VGTSDTSPTPASDEIAALKARLTERDTTVTSQAALIAILEEKLRLATHQQFAPSSEKLSGLGHPDLFFNEAEALGTQPECETQASGTVVPEHVRARGKRMPIDAALPRVRIEHDIPAADKTCACGCARTRIGEVTSEQIDLIPATARVLQHVRFKYACRTCEGTSHEGPAVITDTLPSQPLPKSNRALPSSPSRNTPTVCRCIGSKAFSIDI
jgi:transposase